MAASASPRHNASKIDGVRNAPNRLGTQVGPVVSVDKIFNDGAWFCDRRAIVDDNGGLA